MASDSGPARRRVKLGSLAVSSLFALGLFEIALRVAFPPTALLDPRSDDYWVANLRENPELPKDIVLDPLIGWRMKPMLREPGLSTNSRGLRGTREHEPSEELRRDRVLVLGDSFTFGLGVRDEETYGSVLESLLPGREVLVLGANGHSLGQALLMWRQEGVRYRPGVVVLGYYLDKFHRTHLSVRERPKSRFVLEGGELRCTAPLEVEEIQSGTGMRLRVADTFGWTARKLKRRLGNGDESPDFTARAELGGRLLAELAESVRSTGARLCVAILPDPTFDRFHEAGPIRRSITATCLALDVPCIDLTPVLERAVTEMEPAPFLEEGHWTPAGHALAATEIATVLHDERLRP
jgi:hypothetical protein